MKINGILSALVMFTSLGFAQVDNSEKKSIRIPAKEIEKKDSLPAGFEIKPNEKFKTPKPKTNSEGLPTESKITIKKPEKEFSMIDDNGLRQPGELFEQRYKKVAVEQGLAIETMADVFLGDIRNNGKFVNIVCRDHEYPDGDMVQVIVNGKVIIPRLLLTSGFKGFDVYLEPGINQIVFLALNQGDSGPNTAEFIVYDDNKNLVSSKKWNLLTGVKATINVIKDKNPITRKEVSEEKKEE
ncbi:hypothetical protein [Sediminibacter sp. Hel_I_10]|uniref:hypothetical protein n=1 Tax=Sediminibacter sp. Hel_I_10 TaxID=1392490 RepID=UPI000690480B|nr:hypothetical protein [Sediminibacter sp. Hel_I_10]